MMDHRTILPAGLLVSLIFLIVGCNPERRYEARGRIAGFGDDARTVFIEHEDIPGLMPAMTMPFAVRDTADLRSLGLRDAVAFTLVMTRDSAWVEGVRSLPDSAVAIHPAAQDDPAYTAPERQAIVRPGSPAPDAQLVDQDGNAFRLSDYQGRAVLLTFIYTRCPLPQYCPRMSGNFQRLQPRLRARFGDRVHLLSVSFDPKNDTPEVLKAYARRYTQSTDTWTFATGDPEDIAVLAGRFGVFYKDQGTTITHNLATALVGPDGRIWNLWRGNRWTLDEVMEATKVAMERGR